MKQLLILISIFVIGCKPTVDAPAPRADKPHVAVVNYPLAYFVERIAGDLVEVHFPTMEGDPAFWKPTGADVRKFQSANLVLLNGASYAKWTGQASLPDSKSVNTGAAFADQFIVEKENAAHHHGQAGEHSHAGHSIHHVARFPTGATTSRGGSPRASQFIADARRYAGE